MPFFIYCQLSVLFSFPRGLWRWGRCYCWSLTVSCYQRQSWGVGGMACCDWIAASVPNCRQWLPTLRHTQQLLRFRVPFIQHGRTPRNWKTSGRLNSSNLAKPLTLATNQHRIIYAFSRTTNRLIMFSRLMRNWIMCYHRTGPHLHQTIGRHTQRSVDGHEKPSH